METASSVILIVSLILILAISFFIFQIWLQSKVTKIQLTNFLEELQKGFNSTDNKLKLANEQLIANLATETKTIVATIDILKEQLKQTDSDIKLFKDQLDDRILQLDKHLTGKLVDDLTNITKQYLNKLNEKHLDVLNEFTKTSKDIKEEQKKLLKAITEPLQINSESND